MNSLCSLKHAMIFFGCLFRLCVYVGLCASPPAERATAPSDAELLNSFSSKTAYRNSRMAALSDPAGDYLASCQPVQMNAVFRHGTRFPSAKDMDKMDEVHRKIMASSARSTLPAAFQHWQMPFSRAEEKELASVGYEEMTQLGARFRRRFAAAFVARTDSSNGAPPSVSASAAAAMHKLIKVYSSTLSRSKISATTFLRSFFDETKSVEEVTKLITDQNQFMRFFDNCPHYEATVLKNKASQTEYTRFRDGPEMTRLVKNIQQQWKLTDVPLTGDDVRILYVMCGFEIATNLSSSMRAQNTSTVQSSPLCSLLHRDQYTVLEYIYDLKHYWVKAYGKEINWLQACALMSPLMQHIMQAARGHQAAMKSATVSNLPLRHHLNQQSYHRASFWFGHAETLLPIISLLGLFNQTSPVTSKTFSERMALIHDDKQRFSTFRAANIVPFSGNLELDLYHCPNLSKDGASGYRIQVKVNEKAVAWPLANGHSHISLELFMKHLNLCQKDKYDHDAICVKGMSATQLQKIHGGNDKLTF